MRKYLFAVTISFTCFFINGYAQTLELVKEIGTGFLSSNPYNFTVATNKSAAVILGGRNPLLVAFNSNTADASGAVVPIPTLWAKGAVTIAVKTTTNEINFFISLIFCWIIF